MGHYIRNEGTKTGKSATGQYLDLAIPYWFGRTARRRQENLLLGDYVSVRGLPDRKFELMEVFPKFGSVRVREVGHIESMTFPWDAVTPWKETIKSQTVIRAIGSWLFGRNRVYTLDQPHRILKQKRINWDRETCDLEDEQGQVYYDVPWDSIEFWDPIDYNFPDEAN
jgi:hypothetical protein